MDDDDTDSDDDTDQEYEDEVNHPRFSNWTNKEDGGLQQVLATGPHSTSLIQCQQWVEDLKIFFFCEDIPEDRVRH